jgi:integrase/recombinase XerD
MSTDFTRHAGDYLRLRRALGHQLADAARLLPRFVAHLDAVGASRITTEVALVWVRRPDADPSSSVWLRRMTVVRGFARYMSGIDPTTEVPPLGLVTYRQRWRPPFIYSDSDVEALMTAVPQLVLTPLRAATMRTVIGLLAATGMRVGEALRLDRADIDWADRVLVVRTSKFNKSREVLLDPTVIAALRSYTYIRDRHVPDPASRTFFVSAKGTPVIYGVLGTLFRRLLAATGVGADSAVRPHIHDLRHSFTVHTLVRWYRDGQDVAALLPRLSTYLGHRSPVSTFWYLSAAPELLALAAERLDNPEAVRR